jgi:creatinine amidohydrolase
MPLEFEKLTAKQIDALPRERTVFFFGVGPLEDHGPHLPVGLDVLEARATCLRAAERLENELPGWQGVVMPSLPLGIDTNSTALAFTVRPHVLRDWLVDTCRGLARVGFSHFTCFTGQLGPHQLTAIEEAGKLVTRAGFWRRFVGASRPNLTSASSITVPFAEQRRALLWSDPLEHGGERDTSIALALGALDKRSSDELHALPRREREASSWMRALLRQRRKLGGYWGDPSRASAAQGEAHIKDTVDTVFPRLRTVWQGANPTSLFRSWYSLVPTNKSFFRAWVLTLALFLLLATWFYLGVQGMFQQ